MLDDDWGFFSDWGFFASLQVTAPFVLFFGARRRGGPRTALRLSAARLTLIRHVREMLPQWQDANESN